MHETSVCCEADLRKYLVIKKSVCVGKKLNTKQLLLDNMLMGVCCVSGMNANWLNITTPSLWRKEMVAYHYIICRLATDISLGMSRASQICQSDKWICLNAREA